MLGRKVRKWRNGRRGRGGEKGEEKRRRETTRREKRATTEIDDGKRKELKMITWLARRLAWLPAWLGPSLAPWLA